MPDAGQKCSRNIYMCETSESAVVKGESTITCIGHRNKPGVMPPQRVGRKSDTSTKYPENSARYAVKSL